MPLSRKHDSLQWITSHLSIRSARIVLIAMVNSAPCCSIIGGYNISECTTNIKNGPWATMPWQPISSYQLGITNLVGGTCESASTFTTKSAKSSSLQPATG